LIGAVYLDAGYEQAEALVHRLFQEVEINPHMQAVAKDPKTALQEWLQGRKMKLPQYRVVGTVGEAHRQTFDVECDIAELGLTERGIGGSRRAGEQAAAAAMLAMGGAANVETISNAYPSPIDEHYSDEKEETTTEEDEDMSKPRRRREMQAITKIVETREFPYIDNYFWKNNGNTVQKKTGCKSIYYKCSNSNKVRYFRDGIWRGEVGLAGLPVCHLIGLVDI